MMTVLHKKKMVKRNAVCLVNSPYGGKKGVLEDIRAIQKEENATDHDLEGGRGGGGYGIQIESVYKQVLMTS